MSFTKITEVIKNHNNVISGLGSASTADVTTSPTDISVGRLLQVGALGHGAVYVATDNDMLAGSYAIPGMSGVSTSGGDNFPPGPADRYVFTVDGGGNAGILLKAVSRETTPRDFFRLRATLLTQSPWVERYNTLNLLHLQNTSGATVNSNATVAGSGLTPAQTGTWRNVSGNEIVVNGFGLFMRVV